MNADGRKWRMIAAIAAFMLLGGYLRLAAAEDVSGNGRGFTGFLKHNDLQWQPLPVQGIAGGLQAKTLSRDKQSGAVTMLIYYPAGWRNPQRGYHSGGEELFVLEGDLSIGGQTLTNRCYSYLPAGFAHGPVSTVNGALTLTFFDRAPDFTPSPEAQPGTRGQDFIASKNYYDEAWALGSTRAQTKTPSPLLIKVLRQDEQTGARTWIAGVLGGHPSYTWETHPTWEEGYLLEGEYRLAECLDGKSRLGNYSPGSYFFRPAGSAHVGPQAGAQGYAIWLFRTPAKLEVKFLEKTACK